MCFRCGSGLCFLAATQPAHVAELLLKVVLPLPPRLLPRSGRDNARRQVLVPMTLLAGRHNCRRLPREVEADQDVSMHLRAPGARVDKMDSSQRRVQRITTSALLRRRRGKHLRESCVVNYRFNCSKQCDGASLSKPLREIEGLAEHCDGKAIAFEPKYDSNATIQYRNRNKRATATITTTVKKKPQSRQRQQQQATATTPAT